MSTIQSWMMREPSRHSLHSQLAEHRAPALNESEAGIWQVGCAGMEGFRHAFEAAPGAVRKRCSAPRCRHAGWATVPCQESWHPGSGEPRWDYHFCSKSYNDFPGVELTEWLRAGTRRSPRGGSGVSEGRELFFWLPTTLPQQQRVQSRSNLQQMSPTVPSTSQVGFFS